MNMAPSTLEIKTIKTIRTLETSLVILVKFSLGGESVKARSFGSRNSQESRKSQTIVHSRATLIPEWL